MVGTINRLITMIIGILLVGSAYTSSPPTNVTPAGTFTKPTNVTVSQPIVIDGKSNIILSGLQISNPLGDCIQIRNSTNIIIQNNVIGSCAGTGIKIVDSSSISVIGNYIENSYKAIGAVRSVGVVIDFNYGKNTAGPYPDGEFVQFDNVYGAGNRVRCNTSDVQGPDPTITFTTAYIRTEDHISMYMSRGLDTDNILIAYNRIRGGSSFRGSGIMIGDFGGSYITARANRVVNPWNTGISNAGGNNNTIEYNKIFSNMPNHVANEGMYVRNFTPDIVACYNITHRYNQLTWPPDDWTTDGWTQKFVNTNECGTINGVETNNFNASLTPDIFNEPIAECRALAEQKGYSPLGW